MAIDLGRWLKDRKKQVVDVFDANTAADQQRRIQAGQPRMYQQQQAQQRPQPVQQVNQQQPGWSVRQQPTFNVVRPPKTTGQLVNDSYGTGFTSVANRLKDVINPNTKADQIVRQAKSGLTETYDQQQKRLNEVAFNDPKKRGVGGQVGSSVGRTFATFINKTPGAALNIMGKGAEALPGTFSDGYGKGLQSFGKNINRGIDNRIQQGIGGEQKTDNKYINTIGSAVSQIPLQIATGGLGLASQASQSTSDQIAKAQAKGKSPTQALGIGALQGGLSYASEKVGLDRLLKGGTGNVVKNFATKTLGEGLQELQQQFTENAITNQLYDKSQGLQTGLKEAFVGGLAGGVAGAGISTGINRSSNTAPIQPQLTQTARPNEYNVLSDYQDVLLGNIKDPAVINQTVQQARLVGERLGLDVTSGAPVDINQRINEVLSQPPQIQPLPDPVVTNMPVNQMTDPRSMRERIRAAKERVLTPLNEGGYIQVPGGQDTQLNDTELAVVNYLNNKPVVENSATQGEGNALPTELSATKRQSYLDKMKKMITPLNQGGYAQIPFGKEVSDGLSKDQTEFINEYANMLEDMGSGNGVSINKETGTRISNNARSADIKGKNMSKYDWFEKARQDIEGGKAMYGASEDYKALPGVEAQISQDKPKGLVVSETKPINGQKIQKVRTGPGKVEQRVVQDQSSVIADALGIPQNQRTPTSSFDKQATQTKRIADNINSQNDNIAYNEQPRDIKQKKSKVQFTDTFNRWLGTKQAAKTRSVATARTLKKLNKNDALEAIQAIDNSGYVPKSDKAKQFVEQFRTKTDVLYQRYTGEKGVNMGYVEDYLPRIYKNPEGGEPLTKAEYQALQMSTGRMKGREADQIDVDALITKDPRELLAKYVDSMENVVNNRSFVDSLKKSGHLIESPSRPQGTVIIDAPGFPQPRVFTNPDTGEKIQGNYYATPDVAKVLNRSFEPDIRTSTTGKVLKKTAAVAGKVQDLGLSGGVPGTPINAFGFAQILRNTMGGNIRGTAKGTALSFSKRATDRYFDKHSEDLAELQEQGINVRTSYTEKGLQSFMKRVASAENKKGNSTIPAKTKQLFDESWDTAMNDPTFSRLLPVMQLDYYRHVRDNLKRVGVAPDKASKIAAKRLKEFEGLTDQATLAGRNKVANDALTTFLFAPKYRESMIKFWGNNIKALAPQNIVKALNPKSGEYRSNLIFNAAAVFLFMMMDKENQEQNEGRHLWDNPPGKKDKLLVKIGNGQTIGIPFLSSIATMPRTALNLGNDVISGNTEQLGKDAKSFLGYGIRPIADIVTNEDYFGNKIRRDGASFGENLKRSGMFALKQYNHPYIKAGISKVQSGNTKDPNDPNKKTDLQIVSEAAESPVRFYKDKSVKYGLMYEKFDKDLKGVSNQTKQQFERWHPGRNDMGELEPFDSNNFYSKERADALQDNDLYALEKKYAELQNKYHGKPLDPIFTLGEQERRLVLNKKALKPGQTDPELSKLYDKEWYQDYQNKSSQYYASKNEWNTAQGFESTFKNDNPYPEVPKELQNAMDFYSSLPKGTGARSGFIKSNPDVWSAMTNQWAMKDNWENKERAKYGLAATEGDAGVSNGFKEPTTKYASSSSKGGKGGKGGKGKKLGAIDFGTTDLVSTNKRLQALLGGTTVKAPKNKKVAVKKPKLKKVA